MACKPGSVLAFGFPLGPWTTIPLEPALPQASRGQPGERGGNTPVASPKRATALPIRPCSRWGLPCRRHCWKRGGLLPHRFTLAGRAPNSRLKLDRRSVLCGTFPELALAGHWPAPYFRGARTFLQPRDHSRVQRPSSHPHRGGVAPQGRVGSSLATDCRRASVPPSATPSTHSGRQWRWNAVSRTASGRSVR